MKRRARVVLASGEPANDGADVADDVASGGPSPEEIVATNDTLDIARCTLAAFFTALLTRVRMAALCWRRFSDCRAFFAADLMLAKAVAFTSMRFPGAGPAEGAYSLGLPEPCQ